MGKLRSCGLFLYEPIAKKDFYISKTLQTHMYTQKHTHKTFHGAKYLLSGPLKKMFPNTIPEENKGNKYHHL